jgi:hypothetical protein
MIHGGLQPYMALEALSCTAERLMHMIRTRRLRFVWVSIAASTTAAAGCTTCRQCLIYRTCLNGQCSLTCRLRYW